MCNLLKKIIIKKYENAMIMNLYDDEILFSRYGKSNDKLLKAKLENNKAIVISLDGYPFEVLD